MMQTQGLQQLDVRHMLPLTTADQTLKQITKKTRKKKDLHSSGTLRGIGW